MFFMRMRRWLAPAVCICFLLAFPLAARSGFLVFVGTQVGVFFLVALGLNFLAGYGGQTSVGHGALVSIGAYETAIGMVDHGLSFWSVLCLSVVVTAAAGVVMALPAFRLTAWYFAIVTLGFASVTTSLIIELRSITHGYGGIAGIPAPSLLGYVFTPRDLFWCVAAVSLLAFAVTRNLIDSRFGRGLMAIRDCPIAAEGSGISIVRMKLFAFIWSAVLAGLAGAFFAVLKSVVTPEDFTPEFSIYFLLVIYLGGIGSVHGPLIGTVGFFFIPEFLDAFSSWRLLIYGSGLLLLTLFAPEGLYGGFARLGRRLMPVREPVWAPASASPDRPRIEGAALFVEHVTKRYGGLLALNDVSLTLAPGTIHAIVGPNGSGKTTLLNVITGFYPVDGGSIRIDSLNVLDETPAAIARKGVRRTFQTPKLVPNLTVTQNVMLGATLSERASLPSVALQLPSARREARRLEAEALVYLHFVGLDRRAHVKVGELAHGQQRLVEIARALVGRPALLLLDEPAAGLSPVELDSLRDLIRAISDLGTTIIIVEHRLELLASLCSGVTVLDRGTMLASGPPEAVFGNAVVVAAYMGVRAVPTQEASGASA
jgi:ABC-type branched-subunit amino acid transport system ATPase component/ABC-type branched-subunit amino acid transport system permease subunit